jgi:MFS family permease
MTAALTLLRDHRLTGKRIAAPKREGALAGLTMKMAAMSPARPRSHRDQGRLRDGPKRRTLASAAGKHFQRRTVPRADAFWLMAGTFVLLLFAAGAPTPLYRVYQAQWRFSAITLTAVFAVYALVLLVTLLFFGSLSDHLGRRPVIVAGLALAAGASALFLVASGVGALFAARALQGAAVGLATGAIGAALIDLQREGSGRAPLVSSSAPTMGLAMGALATSALVQYGPAPTRLVWWLLLGAFTVAIAAVLAMPEPGKRAPGVLASLRPRVSVPREARGTFATAVPCLIAVWALGGLYLPLGPSLAAQLLRSSNLLWGGVVIFLLTGVGAAVSVAVRASKPSSAMLGGCLALLAGTAVTFAAIATRTPAAFLLGTALAGAGFGPAFTGAYRTLVALAAPDQRAGLTAAIFIVGYLAFSIPALIAGAATSRYGLHNTALVYSVAIAVLVAAAAASFLFRRGGPAGRPELAAAQPDPPPGPCTVPPCSQRTAPARSPRTADGKVDAR